MTHSKYLDPQLADGLQLMQALTGDNDITQDLAAAMGQPKSLAQQLAYCLRHLSAVDICGKTGNALVYRRIT